MSNIIDFKIENKCPPGVVYLGYLIMVMSFIVLSKYFILGLFLINAGGLHLKYSNFVFIIFMAVYFIFIY